MLELIINKDNNVENIILVNNGKMVENYVSTEEDKKKRLEGNIYVAHVDDIINGMQAAFVDFGEIKKGFIHLKDAIPQIDETKEKIDTSLNIKNVLKSKQKILIQVKKDSDARKGARVSTHISIPGKYIVLMPNTSFITISQKIEDENKIKELKKIVKDILPSGYGAIIRTSAINANNKKIKDDIETTLNKWKEIENKYNKNNNKPELLWESEDIAEKIITDLGAKELSRVITNCQEEINRFKKICEAENIEIVLDTKTDLLSKYDLKNQQEKLENRKIWLNCGGFITIDKTEALTAIDVNTGKFTGKKDLELTIFKVNKEATIEIAKQLRLRDIGGIIIIDYIDMKNQEHKKQIEKLLKQELKSDRAKTQVEGFTKLNLMELTRKHICSHLSN